MNTPSINKTVSQVGSGEVAASPCVKPTEYKFGEVVSVKGLVTNRDPTFGPGGEAPPSGSFLVLSAPIRYSGKVLTEIRLPSSRQAGEHLLAHGNIEVKRWGGVATPGGTYAQFATNARIEGNSPLRY